jgi:hypothetical protein
MAHNIRIYIHEYSTGIYYALLAAGTAILVVVIILGMDPAKEAANKVAV